LNTPLVSFIIVAYNQEQFVDEAAQSALAQDYPNLEIILSDDNSTDRTWSRFEQIAREFGAARSITLNRSAGGKGILAHVYDAVAKSRGDLIVLGAGDDISLPHRVSRLVAEWLRTGAVGLDSHFSLIDEAGAVFQDDFVSPLVGAEARRVFGDKSLLVLHGASTAYAREVFQRIAQPVIPIWNEDEFLCLFLNWRKLKLVRIAEPLVLYRQHAGATTNQSDALDYEGIALREQRARRLATSMADALSVFESAVTTGVGIDARFGTPVPINVSRLNAYIRYWRARAGWLDLQLGRRLLALSDARSWTHLRWMLPRLFGTRVLASLRTGWFARRRRS